MPQKCRIIKNPIDYLAKNAVKVQNDQDLCRIDRNAGLVG